MVPLDESILYNIIKSSPLRKLLKPQVVSCSCLKSKCNKDVCKCYASGVTCSSRCHKTDSSSCLNKHPLQQVQQTPSTRLVISKRPIEMPFSKSLPIPAPCSKINSKEHPIPTPRLSHNQPTPIVSPSPSNTLPLSIPTINTAHMRPVPSLPRFGGFVTVEAQRYTFTNTCSIDTWLAILKAVQLTDQFPSLKPKKLNTLYDLVCQSDYNNSKFYIAVDSRLLVNNKADFYGNECDMFLRPYLQEMFCHYQTSSCTNPKCPSRESLLSSRSFPDVNFNVDDGISAQVKGWFDSETNCICRQPLPTGLYIDPQFVYADG